MARERTIATAMIRNADASRYGTLITDLANQYVMGKDDYPKDITSAKSLLVLYKTPINATAPRNGNQQRPQQPAASNNDALSGLTLAQRTAIAVAGTDGTLRPSVTCYTCSLPGHMAGECPTGGHTTAATTTGTTLTQYAYVLAQSAQEQGEHGIDPEWILLDSQSTISVFKNANMLTNIRHSGRVLRAITNGGHQDSDMVGDFPNLGEVWFNRNSIANILSLAEVRKVCRVTMDTSNEPALLVHRIDGSVMKFAEHPSGLYIYKCNSTTNDCLTEYYTMVSTVAAQKKLFSRREIKSADIARELYRKIGCPDEAEFQSILKKHLIMNCPVTPDDAKRALIIYGPDIAVIKGKTTRSTAAPRAPTFVAVPIPAPILEHHRTNVTLCADFFFVQGLPFFHTISRGIGFRTAHAVRDRTKRTILCKLRDTIGRYTARGLTIRDVHGDNELECTRASLLPITLNVVPADCHVGDVERSIRTIKERLRSCAHGLPFKRLPRLMVAHMVTDAVRCLNQFPWKNGISDTMSPHAILTGAPPPDYNCMRVEFGTYVQLFEDNTPSNTLKSRALGAIALSPTGNAQGDYFFMSLATGKKLSRHSWTVLPMTDTAIARVEAIALHQQQPLIQASGLVVEWRPDQFIDDTEYDLDYVPPTHNPHDGFSPAAYDDIDPDEVADLLADGPHPFYAPPADQGAITDDDNNDDDDSSFLDDDENGFENDNENGFDNNDNTNSIIDDNEDVFGDNDENGDEQGAQGALENENDDNNHPDRNDDFAGDGTDGDDQGAQDVYLVDQGAPNEEAADQGAPNEAADQGAHDEAANHGAEVEAERHAL